MTPTRCSRLASAQRPVCQQDPFVPLDAWQTLTVHTAVTRSSKVQSTTVQAITPRSPTKQPGGPPFVAVRQCRPTVRIVDHDSGLATEMIGDLTTPFMDGSNDVIEIFSHSMPAERTGTPQAVGGKLQSSTQRSA